jgi:hypothetical protein
MTVQPNALERDADPFEAKETSRQQDEPWRGPPGLYAAACELRPLFYLFVLFFKKSRFFYFVFLFTCCVMVSFGDHFSHVFDLSASFPGVFATIGIRHFFIFVVPKNMQGTASWILPSVLFEKS